MLNRRKYQTEAGDEREALLANADSLPQDFQSSHSQTNNNNNFSSLQNQTSNSTFGRLIPNQPISSTFSNPSAPLTTLPVTPVKRKTRSKSPVPDYSRQHETITSSLPYQQQSVTKPTGYYDSYQSGNNASVFYPGEGSVELNLYDPYGRTTINNVTDYVYYTVQPGDTLHNLSIKYSCPIASIKRLNNLFSDQEFYGLTRLKLPAGKLRLIADAIGETNNNNTTLTQNDNNLIQFTNSASTSTPLGTNAQLGDNELSCHNATTTTPTTLPPIARTNNLIDNNSIQLGSESIFKNLDFNIQKARTAALSYDDNATAIMQSLADGGNIVDDESDLNNQIKIATREAESLLIDMSDYGLTYSSLILFVFIVCLVLPLAYVIYLEETHSPNSRNET